MINDITEFSMLTEMDEIIKTAAKLTTKQRKALKPGAFALPGGRYPIHDISHARSALSYISRHGSSTEKAKVRAAVASRYPGIKIKSAGAKFTWGPPPNNVLPFKKISAALGSPAEDDDAPAQTQDLFGEDGKKTCLECGVSLHEDDNHCRKCGARQIVPKKLPRKRERVKDQSDEEKEQSETGGKASQDNQLLEMDKVSALQSLVRMLKPGIQQNVANTAIGTTVVGGGLYGAHEINKAMYGKKKKKQPLQRGMVRTAAVRRRSINPAYNFRRGKKKSRFRILDALVRSRP